MHRDLLQKHCFVYTLNTATIRRAIIVPKNDNFLVVDARFVAITIRTKDSTTRIYRAVSQNFIWRNCRF